MSGSGKSFFNCFFRTLCKSQFHFYRYAPANSNPPMRGEPSSQLAKEHRRIPALYAQYFDDRVIHRGDAEPMRLQKFAEVKTGMW